MAKTTWVLVADGTRARLFVQDDEGLKPALEEEFIGMNLPSRDIASDKQGRSFDSAGQGRHAMERPTDPHRHEKQVFASDIADLLDSARRNNAFDELVVVAPPRALGEVRAALGPEAGRRVVAEVAKDLTRLPKWRIVPHLRPALAPVARL